MRILPLTRAYTAPEDAMACGHLIISFALYFASLALGTMYWGNWTVVAVAVLMFAGAGVRLFAIQHDNGHGSYFSNHTVNLWCGTLLGAFTNNAFRAMRYNHNRHHAFIGNLDQMPDHEVLTWTVRQYREAGFWARVYYRTYRSLPVIFVIGPLFIIFIRYRFPKNALKTGLADVALQNVLMAGLWASIYLIGGKTTFLFFLTAAVFTACAGVIMVYIGHNHEETYWASGPHVDFEEASLRGASVLSLGPVFDFMTFNFAYHDLHHLNCKIPCYRLRQCHIALSPQLSPTRLGLWEALACIRWKLWDEETGKMVRFSAARDPVDVRTDGVLS